MNGADPIKQFEEYHGISIPPWWPNGLLIVRSVQEARAEIEKRLAGSSEEILNTEPSLGIIYQLTERAADQLFGAVVCFSAKCAPPSELAARACLEKSVNAMYMLSGDRTSLYIAWINNYIEQRFRQIDSWEESVKGLGTEARAQNAPRIAEMRELEKELKAIVDMQTQQLCAAGIKVDPSAKWPAKISKRFEGIGELPAYTTAYSRMSSQTHGDAEDTLNYMLATLSDDATMKRNMGKEAVDFSEYLVMFSATFYLKSMQMLCKTFYGEPSNSIAQGLFSIESAMESVAKRWGW